MDRKTTGWIRDLHPIESEDFDLDELSDEDFHIRELKSLRDKMMEEIDARLDKPGLTLFYFAQLSHKLNNICVNKCYLKTFLSVVLQHR